MGRNRRKNKSDRVGRPLEQVIEHLENKHNPKQLWRCTECNVQNSGDNCQNCGRNHYGKPEGRFPEQKDMRPGLRPEASQGFTAP